MTKIQDNSINLVGTINNDDVFLGSCIPCKKDQHYYVITCGHVIYDETFNNLITDVDKIKVTINGESYVVDDVIGDKLISQKTDLAILKISPISLCTAPPFIELAFSMPKEADSFIESQLCLHPKGDESESLVPVSRFLKNKDKSSYYVEVEKGVFFDINKGAAGASAYKGISGSGLFFEHEGSVFLYGILSKLPKITLTTQIIMVNPDVLRLFWGDINIYSDLEDLKSSTSTRFHSKSPWNSKSALGVLQGNLMAATSDRNYQVFICAPSDESSTELSRKIYDKLVRKLKSEGIAFKVGGGKVAISNDDFYPHMSEQNILKNRECNSVIIIADDHSTFSQLSLLSQTMSESEIPRTDMYAFCKDDVIEKQIFMKSGPLKFFQEQIKGKLIKFSQFKDEDIDSLIKDILIHKLCLTSPKRNSA